MEYEKLLYYVNLVLKIVLLIFFIYCVIIGYQFFTWFKNTSTSEEAVISACNLEALNDQAYKYCCAEKHVFFDDEIFSSTCYGLKASGRLPEIAPYQCQGVTCS